MYYERIQWLTDLKMFLLMNAHRHATARGGFLSNALDISGGGARVALPLTWKEGSVPPFRLFFIFDQDTVVDVRATLVRAGDNHLAFQFDAGQPDEIDQLLYETRFIVQEV